MTMSLSGSPAIDRLKTGWHKSPASENRPGRHHLVTPGDIISERLGDFIGIRSPWRHATMIMRLPRWPERLTLAALISRSTSVEVRCARLRYAALGNLRRLVLTVTV
jgi:hypothetical protein